MSLSNEVLPPNIPIPELSFDDSDNSNLSTSDTTNNKNVSSIDGLIDKVGYTKYHFIMLLIVSLTTFIDGSEMIIINLFLSTFQEEWHLSPKEKSLLSSSIFIGFFVGSLIIGYLTNLLGRRIPSIIGTIIVFLFTSFASYSNSLYQLILVRVFIGLGIGIFVPATTCLVTEWIPKNKRSFVLNVIWILFPIGIIYICIISIYFIDENDILLWRQVFKINSLSSLVIAIMTFFLYESPRYYFLLEEYDKAFEVIEKIGNIKLSYLEREDIINNSRMKKANESYNGMTFLFKPNYFTITVILGTLWFVSSFISYGILYILPKLFDGIYLTSKKESILHTMKAMSILAFCPIFRGILSEIQFFGRKNTIILGFIGCIIFGILCSLIQKNNYYISLYSGLLKFCINTSLGIITIYTCEIYPTKYRTISLGMGNAITRIGSILTPFICEYISKFYTNGPFYLFISCGLIGAISCYFLPYETCGVGLDEVGKEKKTKKFI